MLPTPEQHHAEMQQQKRKRDSRTWLAPLLGGLLGGGAILLAFELLDDQPAFRAALDNSDGWVVIPGVFIILFLTLAWHELGHIVGGLAVGFRFALYVVGPLMVVREGDTLRVRLNRQLALYGGIAATTPMDDHRLLQRMQWMVAGGPLASLVFTLGGIAGALLFSPYTAANGWLLSLFAALSGFYNLLAVTLPARTGGFLTDRTRLQLLRRGGPAAERVAAGAALNAQLLAGVAPAQWDANRVATAVGPADGSIDYLANRLLYGYTFALAHDDLAAATGHIAAVLYGLGALPGVLHPGVYLEAAYLAAMNGQPGVAAAWLKLAGESPFVEAMTRRRVEATLALANGDAAEAQAKIAAAHAAAGNASDSTAALESHLLTRLQQRSAQNA